MENTPYLFDQLTRKRSRTNSSSMDDDMEEDEEGGFHGNNNRSPGSQGSAGWEVDQGIIHILLNYVFLSKRQLLPTE